VGDEDGVACEREEAAHDGGDRRRAPQLLVAQARQRRHGRLQPRPRVRERLEGRGRLQRHDPNGAELARPREARPEARRLEVEHHERRVLEQQPVAARRGERDQIAGPAQPRVGAHRVVEERAREPGRDRAAELEDGACGLVGGDRPAPLLDELHQPVGGIQTELHPATLIRTCVRIKVSAVREPVLRDEACDEGVGDRAFGGGGVVR
jgi:hypothetical protein